jgi:hypothetical protein
MLNIKDFGAQGRGRSDDTDALQQAVDAAAKCQDTVYLPVGVYRVGTIRIPSGVGLRGDHTWSYRKPAGTTLQLADPEARCLLELDNTRGVSIAGLCLEGGKLGSNAHGISLHNDQQGWPRESENALRIDHCRIDSFTGDGIHLDKAWAFSIRHCMISHNGGHGIRLAGCDGFFLDNWISGNGGCGFATESWNGSNTFTGNRIEWNHEAGVRVRGGFAYQFTGNYIDRSGGPGLVFEPWLTQRPFNEHISLTGNIIYRSGKYATPNDPPRRNSQIVFDAVKGLSFTGNTLMIGQDDKHGGAFTPAYGMVLHNLHDAVITANNLHRGAQRELIHDLGNHGPNVILEHNPGCTPNDA